MATELIALRAFAEANGGITDVASSLGVTKGVLWAWISRGQVPADQCPAVSFATGVPRWHLRPDDWFRYWPELINLPGAPTTPEPAERAA